MKRVLSLILVMAVMSLSSCKKAETDNSYYGLRYESEDFIAGNYTMSFSFEDNGIFLFECDGSSYLPKFAPSLSSSITYTENGAHIIFDNFAVECTPWYSKIADTIVFHSATWKDGKPKNRQEAISAELIVEYTHSAHSVQGEKLADKRLSSKFIIK